MNIFCQNNTSIDAIEAKDFTNKFILNGKTGKIFIVNSNATFNNVTVRWNNGYFAIGTTSDGKPIGKWFLYDKKNRYRECLIFGPEADCVVYRKIIDTKGNVISEFKAITPCF
jgi:hypothetical protein